MKLSILICSLHHRADLLKTLLDDLTRQTASLTREVEVLCETDDGTATVGAKRNRLLDRAKGDYVVFVDDDDRVSPWYVNGVLTALDTRPDAVAMPGRIIQPDGSVRPMRCSAEHTHWGKKPMPTTYKLRPVNHLNPVRRDIATRVRFADMSAGEDADYADQLKKLIVREAEPVASVWYEYHYNPLTSETSRVDNLYWNKFGCDFDVSFSLMITGEGFVRAVTINDSIVTRSATVESTAQRVLLRVKRTGTDATVTMGGTVSTLTVPAGQSATLEIIGKAARLERAGRGTVGDRPVVLAFKR